MLPVSAYLSKWDERTKLSNGLFKSLNSAELRDLNKPLDSLVLSSHLDKYAETGSKYIDVLKKIIQQNKLKDFDEARLLPSSKDLESLI